MCQSANCSQMLAGRIRMPSQHERGSYSWPPEIYQRPDVCVRSRVLDATLSGCQFHVRGPPSKGHRPLCCSAKCNYSLKMGIAMLEDKFDQIFERTLIRCGVLDIPITERSIKRNHKVPASLQNCQMDRYLTDSSSAATTPDMLPEEALKTKLRIDFFRPDMDVMKAAIGRRFNEDCVQVITHISSVFPASLRPQVD